MHDLFRGPAAVALLFVCGTGLAGEPAAAGPDDPDAAAAGRALYPAMFYAPFTPQTALDMLQRTPGFVLDEGALVRGFAGGAGNVLIDGARPATKADGVTAILRRMPASQVERIEVLRGGDIAEAPGHASVANIIRRTDAGGAGSVELVIERAPHGRVFPNLTVTHARNYGGWEVSGSAGFEWERHPLDSRYLQFAADGEPAARVTGSFPGRYGEALFSGAASGPLAAGTLTLNVRYQGDFNRATQNTEGFDGAGASATPLWSGQLDDEQTLHHFEASVDWTRLLADDWSLKLMGLGTLGRNRYEQADWYQAPGEALQGSHSLLHQRPLEGILRGSFSRLGERRFRPEFGAEIAWNRLGSRLDYFFDDGSGPVPVPLPAADIRVTELRGEVFSNAMLRLSSQVTLEGGLAAEFSRIAVNGDARSSETLLYWKPALAAVWQSSPQSQWRLALRRSVGQLDFGDFAASVDAEDDRPVGGNPELRPDRATRLSLGHDHRYGAGGALAIELWHEWRSDVLEFVPLADGGQGVGNVPRARAWGTTLRLTQPLDALIRGAELRVEGKLTSTRLTDPLTGERRRASETFPSEFALEFRQDVPALRSAWGVEWRPESRTSWYYVDEVIQSRYSGVWTAWAETTAFADVKAKLMLYALDDERGTRWRYFYDPDRSGALAESEWREQGAGGMYAIFTLTKRF